MTRSTKLTNLKLDWPRSREKTQITGNKIKEETLQISLWKLKRIIKEQLNYKQLYTNKLDNLDEMNKYLKRYKLLKLTQEEIII